MKTHLKVTLLLTGVMFLLPHLVYAECAQYQIIDHGDSVEAVCIGKPSTEAEKMQMNNERAIQDRERSKHEIEEANRIKRQSPPEDYDKCYRETFAKTTFKGALGLQIADALAKDLCRMSIERKECVMKMIGGKVGNLMGFNIIYNNALEACN